MNQHAELAIEALQLMRPTDDLARARFIFVSKTPAQMQEPYGQSGMTCREIVEGYEKRIEAIDWAIGWVKSKA